jgi:hypothetical protein
MPRDPRPQSHVHARIHRGRDRGGPGKTCPRHPEVVRWKIFSGALDNATSNLEVHLSAPESVTLQASCVAVQITGSVNIAAF